MSGTLSGPMYFAATWATFLVVPASFAQACSPFDLWTAAELAEHLRPRDHRAAQLVAREAIDGKALMRVDLNNDIGRDERCQHPKGL